MRCRCSVVDILGKGIQLPVECQGEQGPLDGSAERSEVGLCPYGSMVLSFPGAPPFPIFGKGGRRDLRNKINRP